MIEILLDKDIFRKTNISILSLCFNISSVLQGNSVVKKSYFKLYYHYRHGLGFSRYLYKIIMLKK